ncbi:flagellar basal body L-ring protein FlgH [Shewanella sp. 10N.286.45.A1]|uniref:flagellar basal body L-ring protein FlgH n=1 Tax=Shewanella sp. 10N.286.45.A1 TaxID=3229694 RepID=UPI00355353F4
MKFSNSFSNTHVANLISHFSPMNLLPKLFTGRQRYHEGDSLIVVLNNHPQHQDCETISSETSVSSQRLSSSMMVEVTKILPTGALFVSGKKWLSTSAENEYLYLLGIIQADDIGTNNDVSSQCISDARVLYIGEDCLSESDRLAWTLRYFNSHWAPL